MRHRFTRPLLTLSATLLFLAPAFAQRANSDIENIGNRDITKGAGVVLPDLEAEIAIGRRVSSELEQNTTFVQDPVVTEYINRLGQNLVRNSDAKVPFVIRVIDSADVSALALPGGFLFVNRGLILASDDEPELAAMMAHEIAHVTARHAARQQQNASLLNSVPLVIFGGGAVSNAIQQAAAIGVPIAFIAFSRAAEEEADFLGLQYMYKAGYDPKAMVSSFEKLRTRQAGGNPISALFATHPQTEDRGRLAQLDIATYLPARAPSAVAPDEFLAVKARLAGRN